jgi:ferritin-like metal-binding protein YciE
MASSSGCVFLFSELYLCRATEAGVSCSSFLNARELNMPTPPQSLDDLYIEELRDLWSANDQMQAIVAHFSREAVDAKLKDTLQKAAKGIADHTAKLKSLLDTAGGGGSDHCRGMEGLVREAKAHVVDGASGDERLNDLVIVAQYQRMSHYGLAGFGTAAAYAKALDRNSDEQVLKSIVSDIYRGDEIASRLAERLEARAA